MLLLTKRNRDEDIVNDDDHLDTIVLMQRNATRVYITFCDFTHM
jgi:hypothetical protein